MHHFLTKTLRTCKIFLRIRDGHKNCSLTILLLDMKWPLFYQCGLWMNFAALQSFDTNLMLLELRIQEHVRNWKVSFHAGHLPVILLPTNPISKCLFTVCILHIFTYKVYYEAKIRISTFVTSYSTPQTAEHNLLFYSFLFVSYQ